MNIKTLRNGIPLYTYQLSNTHSISISLYIKAGSAYENSINNGITHFLEHLHFRRLGDWSQQKLYYEMERIGSTLSGTTYQGLLRFYMKIRPRYFKEAVNIMKKIILANDWSENEFKEEKQVVIDQILEKNSYVYIRQYVDKIVWKDHPLSYPIMGTEDTVNNLILKDLIDYKNAIFCSDNMFFFISGNFDKLQMEYSEKVLGDIKLNNSKTEIIFPQIKFKPRKPDILFVNNSWHYIDVDISFSIADATMPKQQILLLNYILGGDVGSKLQLKIREEEGLATNIYSTTEHFYNASIIQISFSIIREKLYYVLKMIVDILNDLKNNISDKDLETVFPFYTDDLYYMLDDPEELSFEIAYGFVLFEEKLCNIKAKVSQCEKINTIDLMNCAKHIFKKENLSIVVLGSCYKFKKREIRDIFELL